MFSLSILPILIICEPLLCLARPQYFCCVPCPLTNDCENPYYRETPIPCREEPFSLYRATSGNLGGRCESFLPPLPAILPSLPHGRFQGCSDPRSIPINLNNKCGGEKETSPQSTCDNYDWPRGSTPEGNCRWVLQCMDPTESPPQYGPPYDAPNTEPPRAQPRPAPTGPLGGGRPPSGPPSDGPKPEELEEDKPSCRRSGYSSCPERRRGKFFTNLFSLPGQLADSVLSPLSGEITLS